MESRLRYSFITYYDKTDAAVTGTGMPAVRMPSI